LIALRHIGAETSHHALVHQLHHPEHIRIQIAQIAAAVAWGDLDVADEVLTAGAGLVAVAVGKHGALGLHVQRACTSGSATLPGRMSSLISKPRASFSTDRQYRRKGG